MPFNGAGVYTPPSPQFPAVAGTIIFASKFNDIINDIAAALSATMTKAGEAAFTGTVNMGNNTIINLGDATTLQGAVTIKQFMNDYAHWCGTAGGTANAIALSPPIPATAYAAGMYFTFKALLSNTGAVTVAVSGLTAKALQNLGSALGAGDIVINQWYRVTYDGAAFQVEQLSIFGAGSGFLPLSGGTMTGDIVMDTAVDQWDRSPNIASAATTDLATATGNVVLISGNTTITSFGDMQAGTVMLVKFASAAAPLVTNNAAIILPGGANIQTSQDDWLILVSQSVGVWVAIAYLPASGLSGGGTTEGVVAGYSTVGLEAVNTDDILTVDAIGVVVQDPTTLSITGIPSPAQKAINITTAGPAINGRDQAGAFAAETWVHFYYIYNPTTAAINGIASGNAPSVGPTLPSGYTRWAYIGAIFLDASSDLLAMTIYGSNHFYDAAPFTLASGTASTSTAVDLSEVIPPNCTEWQAIIRVNVAGGGAAGNDWLMALGVDSAAVTAGYGGVFVDQGVPAAYSVSIQGYNSAVLPNVGQNVYYRVYLFAGSTGQGYANLMVPSFKVRN